MYKLTVLFASNTLLSILHDLASSFGTRHNLRGGRREFSDEADKKLRNIQATEISSLVIRLQNSSI